MQNPHELVKKEEKKREKYPRWYKSCIDPWFYFLPDLQFAEKEWIQRLCRSAMIWRVFFFFFSIFSFCTWTRSCHYFCEIFSSVLKVSCCRIYLEITTIWWVRRLKIWYFFLGKRWTSRTVQDQTPNWSFRAQCTQHQTANEPRGTLAEASKELPHNKTACCSTLRYWRQHTGLVEWGEKQPKNKLLFVLNSKCVLVSADQGDNPP